MIGKVEQQKTLHGDAIVHQQPRYALGAGFWRIGIVLGHNAATGDTATHVHTKQRRAKNHAAGVIEVNVYTFRRRLFQALTVVRIFVVHRAIETQFFCKQSTFLITAADAYHMAVLDLRHLAHHMAHRSGGSRDHDGIARLGLTNLEQSKVCG